MSDRGLNEGADAGEGSVDVEVVNFKMHLKPGVDAFEVWRQFPNKDGMCAWASDEFNFYANSLDSSGVIRCSVPREMVDDFRAKFADVIESLEDDGDFVLKTGEPAKPRCSLYPPDGEPPIAHPRGSAWAVEGLE